jgi:hypothetical protein
MDLIPTATPGEIAELSALLESDKSAPPRADANSDAVAEKQPTQAAATPPTGPKPPVFATAAPLSPSASVDRPGSAGAEQAARPSTIPSQSSPGQKPAAFATAVPTLPSGSQDRSGPGNAGQIAPALIIPNPATPALAPNPVTPNQATPNQAVPGGRAAMLFARGLDAELRGDFSGARRFYSSAAQLGDAAAARNLGRLYDPAYVKQTALGGIDPDPALARHWYERAVTLGDAEAGPLLEALSVR